MSAWNYLRQCGRFEYRMARQRGLSRTMAVLYTLRQAIAPVPF